MGESIVINLKNWKTFDLPTNTYLIILYRLKIVNEHTNIGRLDVKSLFQISEIHCNGESFIYQSTSMCLSILHNC